MIDLIPIRQRADQTIGTLVAIRDSPALPNGAKIALGPCIDTLNTSVEEIEAYESTRPRLIQPTNRPAQDNL